MEHRLRLTDFGLDRRRFRFCRSVRRRSVRLRSFRRRAILRRCRGAHWGVRSVLVLHKDRGALAEVLPIGRFVRNLLVQKLRKIHSFVLAQPKVVVLLELRVNGVPLRLRQRRDREVMLLEDVLDEGPDLAVVPLQASVDVYVRFCEDLSNCILDVIFVPVINELRDLRDLRLVFCVPIILGLIAEVGWDRSWVSWNPDTLCNLHGFLLTLQNREEALYDEARHLERLGVLHRVLVVALDLDPERVPHLLRHPRGGELANAGEEEADDAADLPLVPRKHAPRVVSSAVGLAAESVAPMLLL